VSIVKITLIFVL